MRKITLLLLLMLVAGMGAINAQSIVTIGAPSNGAGSTNVLLSTSTTSNLYSKTISIYTASEIITAGGFQGDIVSVGWDKQGTGEYTFGDATMVIYLKNITNSDWSTAPDWTTEVSTATQVFSSNTFSIPTGIGWKTVTFSSPFQWDGVSNVAVFVDWYRPSTPTAAINWGRSTYVNGNATRVGSTSNLVLSVNDNRPLVQFGILPITPCTTPPTAGIAEAATTNVCPGSNVALTLTGNSYGTGQTYQWESAPSISGPWTLEGVSNSTAFITVTPPVGTTYYRCQVTCGSSTVASVPDTVIVSAPFAGVYTINSTMAESATNFQSFGKAFSTLLCAGMTGPVQFNVAPGSGPYNEQLIIDSIPGVSATNRIVIDGNGETISNAASGSGAGLRPTVKLNGADYVTLKNLVVDAAGTTYGWGIQIGYGAEYDSVLNCTINITSTSSTTSNTAGITANGSETTVTTDGLFNNIAIIGNTINGGYQSIILNGSSSNQSFNNYIANNTIKDYHADGIVVTQCIGTQILNNDISRPTRTVTTTHTGIELGGGNTQAIVSNNRIHNTHDVMTTQSGIAYGIHLTSCDAPVGQENLVSNNLIYNFNSLTGTQSALRNTGSDGAFFYHNTVVLDNPTSTSGATYAFYQTTSATNIDVKNNVFYITRAGSGTKHCLYLNTAASTVTSDNNVLYMNAPAGTNYIGRSGGNDFGNLSAWQGAGFDLAGSDQDPVFQDIASVDYTTTNTAVNNIGTPLASVTADINGISRSSAAPDPGAFENLNYPLSVTILNVSAVKQNKDVEVFWAVANEKNMRHYTIERSFDGKEFSEIGLVKVLADNKSNNYQHSDYNVFNESSVQQVLYRLKIVDNSGSHKYSEIVRVTAEGHLDNAIDVYPNPVSENLTISIKDNSANVNSQVSIIDINGKIVFSEPMKTAVKYINVATLPKGIYMVTYTSGKDRRTFKITKE